jgi:hypothetical protein
MSAIRHSSNEATPGLVKAVRARWCGPARLLLSSPHISGPGKVGCFRARQTAKSAEPAYGRLVLCADAEHGVGAGNRDLLDRAECHGDVPENRLPHRCPGDGACQPLRLLFPKQYLVSAPNSRSDGGARRVQPLQRLPDAGGGGFRSRVESL